MVAVASPVLIYSHLSIDQTGVCTSSLDIVNIVYIGSCEISFASCSNPITAWV